MRYNIKAAAGIVLAIAFAAGALFSQAFQTAKPSFEVTSVKRNNSGGNFGGIGGQTDRFTAKNTNADDVGAIRVWPSDGPKSSTLRNVRLDEF